MLSTLDVGNAYVEVQRKVKEDGKYSVITVKQPSCIQQIHEWSG